ncbi:MAG: hypothetical protein IT442_13270 [Phycisphaeraceae bacterium]|nr:hypothetical protein [Phycisphaeraceae bacterium]
MSPRNLRNPRRLRSTLYAVAGLLVVTGLVLGGVLILAPLATAERGTSSSKPNGITPVASTAVTDSAATPTRESLLALGSLPLRRPLYDTAAVTAAAPTKVVPPLRVKLLGTVIEPGQSVAIVQDSTGKTLFLDVGQTVEDATIQSIEPDRVTVRYYDEDRELVMPKAEPASPQSAPNNGGAPRP